jgi:hypothetical protein
MKFDRTTAQLFLSILIQSGCLSTQPTEAQGFISDGGTGAMSHIPPVNRLRDVGDHTWTHQTFSRLVERYGCLVGHRATHPRLSRWEFAAELNTCLNAIERLSREGVAVAKKDVEMLQRLAREFEPELAVFGTKIDDLAQRAAFLEDHQFATTTKLKGDVMFVVSDTFGDAVGADGDRTETTVGDRVRLAFDTSFQGHDLLRVRLQANLMPDYARITGTDMTRLTFDFNSNNRIFISDLFYRFRVGQKMTLWLGTAGTDLDDLYRATNPYLESGLIGAFSRFLRYNPLSFRGPLANGMGAKYTFNPQWYLTASYLANQTTGNNPLPNRGLFNGSFSAATQLGFNPTPALLLTFNYVHTYETAETVNITNNTGSIIGRQPFGPVPTTSDRYSVQFSWKLDQQVHLGGWFGYGTATAQKGSEQGNQTDLWTWSANISFLDIFKQGSVLSVAGGLPVKTGKDLSDSSHIIEAQYLYPIRQNLWLNPGFFVVLNPEHNKDNSPIWVGVMRTTFRF